MALPTGAARALRLLALGPLFYSRRAPGTAAALTLLVAGLTLLTQVGGVLLWLCLPLLDTLQRRLPGARISGPLVGAGVFLCVYLAVSLALIPPLAALFGRVPLPCRIRDESAYSALTSATCLFNRHYATPSARAALADAARRFSARFPDRRVSYLDAGFPFFDWFPMLPHLSHGDGRKIDFALPFLDSRTGRPLPGRARSPIGYWGYVPPAPDAVLPCRGQRSWLRWDFDWLQPLLPAMRLDTAALAYFVDDLAASDHVSRLLVEPHLWARLGTGRRKVRFQGCAAARHDDHIHVEFR